MAHPSYKRDGRVPAAPALHLARAVPLLRREFLSGSHFCPANSFLSIFGSAVVEVVAASTDVTIMFGCGLGLSFLNLL